MKPLKTSLIRTAGITTAAVVSVLSLNGCSSTIQVRDTIKVQNVSENGDTISVTGQEEVKVTPDMAQIRYSIYTQEDTAALCQEINSKDLSAAIETLKGLGIKEESIQTSSYGLSPIQNWRSDTQEVTGYEMTTDLTVTDIPIDQVGEIISQSVASGVNNIDSVSYFSSNYDACYQDALKGAIAIAQKKAEAIAEASGKSLGSLVHVEEYGYSPDTRYSSYSSIRGTSGAAKMEAGGAIADMAVMPGQVSVEATVLVDFKLAQ